MGWHARVGPDMNDKSKWAKNANAARRPRKAATSTQRIAQLGGCTTCRKQAYPTRAAAKEAARVYHPGAHLTTYRCGNVWHLGHVDPKVRRIRNGGDDAA